MLPPRSRRLLTLLLAVLAVAEIAVAVVGAWKGSWLFVGQFVVAGLGLAATANGLMTPARERAQPAR